MNAAPIALSPAVPLSDVVHSYAPETQAKPAIASDGGNFLAVWEDARGLQEGGRDVYASRIDATGRILDPLGIPIIPTFTDDIDAAVVWNGTNYLVVYATPYVCLGLTAVEVSPQGSVIGGRAIVRPACGTRSVSMAWNGNAYLVAWVEPESGVHGIVVDRFFNVLVPDFAIAPLGDKPSVASDGAGFLVVWEGGRFAAVSSDGKVGPVRELFAGNSRFIVASDGAGYVLARGGNDGIHLTRVSSAGEPLHSAQIETATPARGVALASDGARFSLAWQEQSKFVMAAELTASLATLDAPKIAGEGGESIAVARSREKSMVVWSSVGDVIGAEPGRQPFLVTTGLQPQRPQAAAWNGETWGVLWNEENRARFGRVDALGNPLDGAGIDIGTDAVDVIADGDAFVVTAMNRIIRIARDLSKVEEVPVADGRAFRTISDGDRLLVFLDRSRLLDAPPLSQHEIFMHVGTELRRVSPAVADEKISYGLNEVVRVGGELFAMLTRTRYFNCGPRSCGQGRALELVRIAGDGRVSAPIAIAPESVPAGATLAVGGGGTMLAVWIEERSLLVRPITAKGELLATRTLFTSPAAFLSPSVVWDGTSFVVAAEERQEDFTFLRSARVAVNGEISEEGRELLARMSIRGAGPFLTAGPPGRLLLLYSEPRLLVPHSHNASVDRAYVRTTGLPPRSRPVR